jgi:phospholipid/cholesterol/gamma-HCH transport system substrate-binding protein
MDEWVLRFRVGVVVVAAAIITIVLVMLFGATPTVFRPQYRVDIRFPEAPGIAVDTPIRKSGVLIGRVSDVKLLEEGGVLVSTRIDSKYPLRNSETCRIASGSLLGDAVLEFVPAGDAELLARFDANRNDLLDAAERQNLTELLQDGDLLTDGVVANNPLRTLVNLEDDVRATFGSLKTAGDEVTKMASSVNSALEGNDEQIPRLIQKTEMALDRFASTMNAFEQVLGDEQLRDNLTQSLKDIPIFIQESRETMAAARTTLEGFEKVSAKAEANLDNLEGLTRPLGERGQNLVDNIEASTRNMNELLEQLVAFSESLNSGQGTLGKLVHDDQAYQRIERLLENAEDLTVRIRPIIEDVRVFTDKIARDPRQLGVAGALDRRPSGLKTGLTR